MTYETLKRLAANPQYKMSPSQIAELKQYQALERAQDAQQPVRHPHDVPTHPTGFHGHPTDIPAGGSDGTR